VLLSHAGGGGGVAFSHGGGGGGASSSQGSGTGGASFSQGGGSASLLHVQSQLSQASLGEHLLSLLLQAPARDQVSYTSPLLLQLLLLSGELVIYDSGLVCFYRTDRLIGGFSDFDGSVGN
jgi:hypothetical protein